MPGSISLDHFVRAADAASFGLRGLKVEEGNHEVKLGNRFFTQAKEINDTTMDAFRAALSKKEGVFGERAFDAVIGERRQLHKDLRACDVKAVISKLPDIRVNALKGELMRRLDTDPKLLGLSEDARRLLRPVLLEAAAAKEPFMMVSQTEEDIARMASDIIKKEVEDKYDSLPQDSAPAPHASGGPESKTSPWKPMGLDNIKSVFDSDEASIEDRIKTGALGTGQRINRSSMQPMLLEQLKENGVEPGFIYRDDWSGNDTRMMMKDFSSPESREILERLEARHPEIAAQGRGKDVRERIMLFGRMHPAGMAAVADYMLEKGMADPHSAIFRAFREKFPGMLQSNWRTLDPATVKKELFPQIRDAIMAVKKPAPDPNGRIPSSDYDKSPIFRQFNEHHIVKLDYNESARIPGIFKWRYMRPLRTAQKYTFGTGFRLWTAQSTISASAGAVTEALANDLTRVAHVPAQEMRIVRGQYSDGHPKLMLEAKFADDYHDITDYLQDGQIVAPEGGTKPESLGKYKAFFLTIADRDAVGSRGQNKGISHGKFFSIDPGHALEDKGSKLTIRDDFSFSVSKPVVVSRFSNYSVFDDDSRFQKVLGAVKMRNLRDEQKFKEVFDSYRAAFNPEEPGISSQEKKLRKEIRKNIDEKEKEFNENLDRMLAAVDSQIKLFDGVSHAGREWTRRIIETVSNLEKLTSPTTWVSPNKKVPLKHLAVIPGKRVPWDGTVEGTDIVYRSRKPLSPSAQKLLRECAAKDPKANLTIDNKGFAKLTFDGHHMSVSAIELFSETSVAKATHPEEYAARISGGTGLDEARDYNPL